MRKITTLLVFLVVSQFVYSQQKDIKQVLKNQIQFFKIQNEKEEKSFMNLGIESYEAIKKAEDYLKSQNIPIYDNKEEHALADGLNAIGVANRNTRKEFIYKLEQKLKQLENPSVQSSTQPISKDVKDNITTIINALDKHQKIQKTYDEYLQRQQQLLQNINQQLNRQIEFEKIQQQTQPLNQQQRQQITSTIQNIQQQQQQQQYDQIMMQQQQMQQMQQIQQSAQPLSQDQQQMVQQVIQSLQQQQQQVIQQQQLAAQQQQQYQNINQ